MPASAKPPAAPRIATSAALLLAAAPLLAGLALGAGGMVRYASGLPMSASAWIGGLAMGVAAGGLVLSLSGGLRLLDALLAAVATAGGLALAVVRLWNPQLYGMATVGGGDAGHHVFIANQLAGSQPRIYLGFTAFHAAAWSLAQVLGGPFEGFRAAFYLNVAGWMSASVLLVMAVARGRSQPARIGRMIGLLVVLPATWWRLHLCWAHYYQADGFYAQLYATLPLTTLLLVWAAIDPWRARLAAAAAVIVALRFTYGLNLPDVLLVCSVPAVATAARHRGEHPRWWALVLVAGAGGVGAAAWGWYRLSGSFFKPGGLTPLSLPGVGTALLAGVVAVLAAARLAGPDRRASRLALLAAGVSVPPLLLCAAFLALPSLPRSYYFHKYSFGALVVLTSAAPGLVAALLGRLASPGREAAAGPLPPSARIAPGSPRGGHVARGRRALAGLGAAGLLILLVAADRSSSAQRQGYLERAGERPLHRVEALHDPRHERIVREVLAARGRRLAVYMHPRWPVFNFSDNVMRAFSELPPAPVKNLQEARWRLFVDGALPGPDQCSFWVEGKAARAGFERLLQRNPGARVMAVIEILRRSGRSRCRPPGAGGSPPLCWVCS